MRALVSTLLAAATLLLSGCLQAPRREPTQELTILVGIDGFRWDYLEIHAAPTLRRLAAEGVRARRMEAAFPTKTFPNHYTLVTGLRPESHGIVANGFFDPAVGESFTMSRVETHWWAGGEPVWITAEKQGVRSACFFWPGSESELQGRRPSFFRPFQKRLTSDERVDGLLAWLALPAAERPRFATLYFCIVDDAGHQHGPTAPETGAAVRTADAAIARLLAGLERLGLRDRTNLVFVSDHGMADTSPERVIFIEDLVDTDRVQVEALGPNGGVRPKPGTVTPAELAASIRDRAPPPLQVYLREEVPAELHYRRSERIPPVVLVADEGWNLESKAGWPRRRATYSKGNHGWDPALQSMGALFVAHGPAIRPKQMLPEARSLDVYELLCGLLGIAPAPHEGDGRLARAVLR